MSELNPKVERQLSEILEGVDMRFIPDPGTTCFQCGKELGDVAIPVHGIHAETFWLCGGADQCAMKLSLAIGQEAVELSRQWLASEGEQLHIPQSRMPSEWKTRQVKGEVNE